MRAHHVGCNTGTRREIRLREYASADLGYAIPRTEVVFHHIFSGAIQSVRQKCVRRRQSELEWMHVLKVSLIAPSNVHIGIVLSANTHDLPRNSANSVVVNWDKDELGT